MRKLPYILSYLCCFGIGAYAWRLKSSGVAVATEAPPTLPADAAVSTPDGSGLANAAMIRVGNETITQDDVDWEFRQHINSTVDHEVLTPIPDLGDRYNQELVSLRRALIGSMIERKILYIYLQQDHAFDFDKPSRYTVCMSQWQQAMSSLEPTTDKANRERMKASLCERSIISQYMAERLFADVRLEERELREYYKNHLSDFKTPERVRIRHILAANESAAKTLRAQANQHNFESLAREHSIAPEGSSGGILGPFVKGSMPAVFEVAFHLKPGEISETLKSNYGYHLIMLLQHYPKQQLAYPEVRSKIAATLRKVKQEEHFSKWVEKALAAINVTTPKAVW
jgi:hypothetical protein